MKLPEGLADVLADGVAPAVTRWATGHERRILREGVPLEPKMKDFADRLGIRGAGDIRVMEVPSIPLPVPDGLIRLGRRMGLPVFAPVGMALGKGIYLLPGHAPSLAHELVHVMQYQREGGIGGFMKTYLKQCLRNGYANSALELEARVKGCRSA